MCRFASLAALLVAGAMACRPPDQSKGTATHTDSSSAGWQPGFLRGLVTHQERPTIVPCRGTDTLQLRELSPTLAGLRAPGDTGSQFVVVAGQRIVDQYTVDRVLYASKDRFECFADWSGFAYRATGRNPGWLAEVVGDRLVVRREGGATFTWPNVQMDSTADRIQFTASADTGSVQLTLQLQPCRNPVSLAYSAWT
ncbi:MAG: hypothetical protein ACRENP_28385, partial [Longimicrobiales bacterium]